MSDRAIEFALSAGFAVFLAALSAWALVRARTASPRAAVAATLLWAGALAFMTLRPGRGHNRLNLVPVLVDGPGSALDAVLNVLVFLPFGMALGILGVRWWVAALAGLAVSVSIEVTQFALDVGRTADVNDLITNTLGTLLGALLVAAVRGSSPVQREPEDAAAPRG